MPLEYLNFDLSIERAGRQTYTVRVLYSPAGEARATIKVRFTKLKLDSRSKAITRDIVSADQPLSQPPPDQEAILRQVGSELFDQLFARDIHICYERSLDQAREQKKGLRLRLRVLAPELAAAPWEYMYDHRNKTYLCLSARTPLVRYQELAQPVEPLAVSSALSILGLTAAPHDLPSLDVARERKCIERALDHLRQKGAVELEWLEQPTVGDLQSKLRRRAWHIVHFVGHGDFDHRHGEGWIALVNKQGAARRLTATELARLLADQAELRLVLLNACAGGEGATRADFLRTADSLVAQRVPAVIAMQDAITDPAAIQFAEMFYASLADGYPVDAAVAEARKAMSLNTPGALEWGTPVLYMRAADGRLFTFDPAGEPAPTKLVAAKAQLFAELLRSVDEGVLYSTGPHDYVRLMGGAEVVCDVLEWALLDPNVPVEQRNRAEALLQAIRPGLHDSGRHLWQKLSTRYWRAFLQAWPKLKQLQASSLPVQERGRSPVARNPFEKYRAEEDYLLFETRYVPQWLREVISTKNVMVWGGAGSGKTAGAILLTHLLLTHEFMWPAHKLGINLAMGSRLLPIYWPYTPRPVSLTSLMRAIATKLAKSLIAYLSVNPGAFAASSLQRRAAMADLFALCFGVGVDLERAFYNQQELPARNLDTLFDALHSLLKGEEDHQETVGTASIERLEPVLRYARPAVIHEVIVFVDVQPERGGMVSPAVWLWRLVALLERLANLGYNIKLLLNEEPVDAHAPWPSRVLRAAWTPAELHDLLRKRLLVFDPEARDLTVLCNPKAVDIRLLTRALLDEAAGLPARMMELGDKLVNAYQEKGQLLDSEDVLSIIPTYAASQQAELDDKA
jgi:hypothetical protein